MIWVEIFESTSMMQFCHPNCRWETGFCHSKRSQQRKAGSPHNNLCQRKVHCGVVEPGTWSFWMFHDISRWFLQIKAQNDRSCCRETDRILVRSDLHSEKTAPQSLENSPPVGSAQVHPDKCWSNARLISGWALLAPANFTSLQYGTGPRDIHNIP